MVDILKQTNLMCLNF